MDLHLMPEYVEHGARCLDGTPFGYYLRKALRPTTNWVMNLEGGGLCITPIDCYMRMSNGQGSSDYWARQVRTNNQITSSNPDINPFHNYNAVYLRYCSGDTWTGTRTSKVPYNMYFAGHHNLHNAINALVRDHDLGNATRLIFAGNSAGGIGVFSNADWVQALLPKARVLAIPHAGYFFPAQIATYTQWVIGNEAPINSAFTRYVVTLEASYLNPACYDERIRENMPTWECWDANVAFNYSRVPTFVVQSLWDDCQVQNVLLLPPKAPYWHGYLDYFGKHVIDSLNATMHDPAPPLNLGNKEYFTGLWMPACWGHTGPLCVGSNNTVSGVLLRDALARWVAGDGRERMYYYDHCLDAANCMRECSHYCG